MGERGDRRGEGERFLEGEGRERGARREYKKGEARIERKEIGGNMGDKEEGQGEREDRKEIGWKKGKGKQAERYWGEGEIFLGGESGEKGERSGRVLGVLFEREKGRAGREREERKGRGGKKGEKKGKG
jgi:hypothetical protein